MTAPIDNGHCPCCGCDYCPNDCDDGCCKAAAHLPWSGDDEADDRG